MSEPTVREVYRLYLQNLQDEGKPKAHHDNRALLFSERIEHPLGERTYSSLVAHEFQNVIDGAAMEGDEKSAERLKNLFVEVEKFAQKRKVIVSSRTRKLVSPEDDRDPRTISDLELGAVWQSLDYLAQGGAVPDRGPALLILLSVLTLRPAAELIGMRRDEVVDDRWIRPDGDEVFLSTYAREIVARAIEHADFIHREVRTPYVFPSAGPGRDPMRRISYSAAFEVMARVSGRAKIRATDPRHTAIVAIKRLGAEPLGDIVDRVGYGRPFVNDTVTMILSAWSGRVRELAERNRR